MSLDQFMRKGQDDLNITGKTVILQGENAGVDAAVEVVKRGGKLVWLMSEGKMPVWLSSGHYHIGSDGNDWVADKNWYAEEQDLTSFQRLKRKCEEHIVHVPAPRKDEGRPSITKDDGESKLTAKYTNKTTNDDRNVVLIDNGNAIPTDKSNIYFVYAIGQNSGYDTNTSNDLWMGPEAVFDNIKNDLRPFFDINQHFGQPLETLIGVQYKESSLAFNDNATIKTPHGIFVIGAAITPLSRFLKPPQIMNQNAWLAESGLSLQDKTAINIGEALNSLPSKLGFPTVVAQAQLGAIRAQLQAMLAPDIEDLWMIPVRLLNVLRQLEEFGNPQKGLSTYKYAVRDEDPEKSLLANIQDALKAYIDKIKNIEILQDLKDLNLEDITFEPQDSVEQGKRYKIKVPSGTYQKIVESIKTLEEFIRANVNLNGMNTTNLFIFLSQLYPHLDAEEQIPRLARYLISDARNNPWGLTKELTDKVLTDFDAIHEQAKNQE